MTRTVASMVAATLIPAQLIAAACVSAQAAGPFPEVPLHAPARESHVWAYASMAAGAGLIAGSFGFAQTANDFYDEYLVATDPEEIVRLYNRTRRYDRISSGSLLGGELLIATGLYLRFLHRPTSSRLSFAVDAQRCAVAWRF